MLKLGQHLQQGRYRIRDHLGQGGMGTVYLAEDLNLARRLVAIKENADTAPATQQQFQHEAHTLAGLLHPNLPRVIEHFVEPSGRQYLVMDYVPGDNLHQVLQKSQAPLPEREVLAWIAQVLEALAYMHNWVDPASGKPMPIIHRDIKPANIKQAPNQQIVLVDFGLAKFGGGAVTILGARAVTPGYSPVEQYTGGTTVRSDIYALGATLYTLLTGEKPPEAPSLAAGVPLRPPRQLNPQISRATERVILRAMQVQPANRYATVEEMRAALFGREAPQLRSQRAPAPPLAQPASRAARAGRWPRAGLWLGLALFLLLLGISGGLIWQTPGSLAGLMALPGIAPAATEIIPSPTTTPRQTSTRSLTAAAKAPATTTPSSTSTASPTSRPIGTVTPSATARPKTQPIATATLLITPTPTQRPSPTATRTATPKPRPTSTARPTATRTPTPRINTLIAVENANLRAGPSTLFSVLTSYPQGTAVKILGKNQYNSWVYVRTPTGLQGWMALGILTTTEDMKKLDVLNSFTRIGGPDDVVLGDISDPNIEWLGGSCNGDNLRNFKVEARFYNPNGSFENGWDYGFQFREKTSERNSEGRFTILASYELQVDSKGNWSFELHGETFKRLSQGQLANLILTPNGSNLLRLEVLGNQALFSVNGQQVAILDVAENQAASSICVRAGFGKSSGTQGLIIPVKEFLILSNP